ncbi:endo-1,4-beta-xylanase [Cohnella fermenti]|uniref:Beta-xylanase n=1 Tax=Cohnella fermenti TaxID=2565925 RepID=A0A4S4BTE1_9BACL|nr:endo-1,4-beta-xylanase [Cohnella fermenti]THF76099.1 1,4-beta-xylanase [Cohnella fermenti]
MRRRMKAVIALLLSAALVVPAAWGAREADAAETGDTVMSASFDSGTDNWFKRGTETVAQATTTAQSGAGSLLTTGRTSDWNGPGVSANELVPGATYDFSIYAKLKEGTTGAETLVLTINQQNAADTSKQYAWVANASVTADAWVKLQGELTLESDATGFQIYVQSSTSATVDYYVDTFAVKLVALPDTESDPVVKVPVVVYHKVNQTLESGNDYQVSAAMFATQMKYLDDNGYTTLSANEYADIMNGEAEAPDNPILLTFDDGTPDFYTNAWPVLQQYGMKATLFIVSDWIGENKYGMTLQQLQTLADDPNLDLENHTKTHTDLTTMEDEAARDDIVAAGDFLEGVTGKQSALLAYPYGAYNADVAAAAEEAGIEFAFKVGGSITTPAEDKYGLGRQMMVVADTLATFAAKIGGPAPSDARTSSGNVVLSQSFEDDLTGGWENMSWAGEGAVSVSSDVASEGTKSLKFSGRDSRASSVLKSMTGLMLPGRTYDLSLKVRLGEGTDELHLGSNVEAASLDNKYPWLVGNQTVTADGWTTFALEGYEVPEDATAVTIWLESSSSSTSTADIYIDEVVLTDVTPDGFTEDFENGIGNWTRRFGSSDVAISDAANHTDGGQYSLLTTVSQQYDGPILDILGGMHAGNKITLSGWVRMAEGQASTILRISVQSGDSTFTNVSANATVTSDGWTQLSGTFTLSAAPTVLKVYVEAANAPDEARSFYLDDFVLAYDEAVEGPLPAQTDLDQLKELYADYFKIGAAVEQAQIEGSAKDLLDLHYNSLVSENSMKPGSLNPSEDVWNWTAADKVANYAKENELDLRLHTLAWHSQAAEWMFKDSSGEALAATEENKELVLERLETYIRTVAGHMKTLGVDIQSVDVVNEVIDEGQADGMRRSEWYRLTGTDFIKTAFEVAHEELPDAKLYINDYNTHDPKKRDFLYNLVTSLKGEGVPIDGVGHQTHINISGPSIQQISDSIRKFGEAGFDNQITELDVSVYTDSGTKYDEGEIPEAILVKQGYRYKELFKELVRLDELGRTEANPEGWISNVTLWGISDDHTWLTNMSSNPRTDAPFPFDYRHQAKYAYWGMVEAVKTLSPSMLPISPKAATTAKGTPTGASDTVWNTVPAISTEASGTLAASVKTLWDESYLYVRVAVSDATVTATDQIELFVDDGNMVKSTFARGAAATSETTGGYVLETAVPLEGTLGRQVKFDVRITDQGINDGSEQGGNGVIVSWSDPRSAQDSDSEGYGTLTYIDAVKLGIALRGTPEVDGELDGVWADAPTYTTDVVVEQSGGAEAKAEFRALWDSQYLYVYAVVTDSMLSDAISNAWEQDSVEIFVDQNNGKTSSYEEDDGQYRINYKNVKSVGGHASQSNYTSATKLTDGGYIVEAAIALDTIAPVAGTLIGFDLQVNNDQNGGTRDSVFIWSDPTGQSYMNTSRFGVLELKDSDTTTNPGTDPGTSPGTSPSATNPASTDPIAVKTDGNGKATATVGAEAFKAALNKAKDGLLSFDIPVPADIKSVVAKLPAEELKAAAKAGAKTIAIGSGLAKLILPIELLIGTGTDDAEVTVSRVDASSLPVLSGAALGGAAVYDFALSVDGKTVGSFGDNRTVRIDLPYTLPSGARAPQVVVYYVSESGQAEVVKNGRYDAATGTVSFRTGHFSQYAVATAAVGFTDLDRAAWASDSIVGLAARGIVKGVSDTAYAPGAKVTRAEFAQLLVRAFDLQAASGTAVEFKDVKAGAWYVEAIATAQSLGIVQGKPDGTFGVEDEITRQDMAVMLYRALNAAGLGLAPTGETVAFGDGSSIAGYAQEAAAALAAAGVVTGLPDGSFAPLASADRAQAAVMLDRLLQAIE